MFHSVFKTRAREALRRLTARGGPAGPTILPGLDTRPAPMRPVRPPPP
ncbi:hypothetical protein ACFQFG_18835 [Methylobacterium persicinum]